jgi:hypothetical protein
MSFLKKFDKLKDKFLGDDDKKEGHGEGASQPFPPPLKQRKTMNATTPNPSYLFS